MSAYARLGSSTQRFGNTAGWPKAGVPATDGLTVAHWNRSSDEPLTGGFPENGSATIWTLLLPSVLTEEEVERFPL